MLTLLRDEELESLAGTAICELPDRKGKEGLADDPIQAASVDLHVGAIFTPGAKDGDRGGLNGPRVLEWALEPGGTVLVATQEKLKLSRKMAAIGLGAFGLARNGILTPDIGHIDPGYAGPLRIVLINMGKKTVFIKADGTFHVCTILIFELQSDVKKCWTDRNGSKDTGQQDPVWFESLSSDFGSFHQIAQKTAKAEVEAATETTKELVRTVTDSTTRQLQSGLLWTVLAVLATGFALTFLTKQLESAWYETPGKLKLLEYRLEGLEKRLGPSP